MHQNFLQHLMQQTLNRLGMRGGSTAILYSQGPAAEVCKKCFLCNTHVQAIDIFVNCIRIAHFKLKHDVLWGVRKHQ